MTSADGSPITVLSVFATFDVGGPQVRFAAVANHFKRRIRHFLFAMDGNYRCLDRFDSNLDCTRLSASHRKGETLANVRAFRRLLAKMPIDWLVTHNWGSFEWAMANWPKIKPHIHIEDGFGAEEADMQIARRVWARRFALPRSTLVVPSRRLQRIALDIWKLSPSNVRYIPNGIDIARFSSGSLMPPQRRDGLLTIGTVAALRPEKNLLRLIEAFRRIRDVCDCRLVIAGDGPERKRLEERAKELALEPHVVFLGYTSEPYRVYAGLDIFALSSDTEQMPTSLLEAMAAGLPIAGTNVGDVASVVSRENASFIVEKDTAALASAIARLAEDSELRMRIGEANRAIAAREYSEEEMFNRYGELLGIGA